MCGLNKDTIDKILNVFLSYRQITDVILFGSRALGTYKNGSDIDISLKGDLNTKHVLSIMNDLDDLFLPYEFDLNLYDRIENVDLKEHIDRVGVSLFKTHGGQ